ncbi:MAG: DUF3108 domain-containing protein [Deltaproteobacteria bacterium]|nr:DUF3108 domain-containing protein [Deltaproteobacteria bacterium]
MSRLLRCVTLSLLGVAVSLASFPAPAADKRPPQPAAAAPAQARVVPAVFARGETLAYTATLNELPAGDVEIRLRKERQDEREVYRITAQARTGELIDYLYRLRGSADGTFTANGFTPLLFRLTYTEGERQRELGVRYDPAAKTLRGSMKKRERVKERSVPAVDVYDPITALYLLRSRDLTPGTPLQVEVFTGKERYRIVAQVVRKEDVQLTSGVRPAIRLHPEVFSLDDAPQENLLPQETTLWVTVDGTHTPLKLESFVPIGKVVVELSNGS